MLKRLLVTATAGCGLFVLTGQQAVPPAIYTAAQAANGRTAYQSSCGKCHTDTLMGRVGDIGEVPPLSSLPANMQQVVRAAGGKVPPLAGDKFMARWGVRTTKDLSTRIKDAVGGFPPQDLDEETYLNLTAYVLQSNGAQPGTQALTAATAVEIRSLNMNAHSKVNDR